MNNFNAWCSWKGINPRMGCKRKAQTISEMNAYYASHEPVCIQCKAKYRN